MKGNPFVNSSIMTVKEALLKTPSGQDPDTKPPLAVTSESTFLNPAIKSKTEIKDWVYAMLGYPLVNVELTDAQFDVCIQNALQLYTKYAYFDDKYLMVDANNYEKNKGIDLSQWNVTTVKDMVTTRDAMYGIGSSDFFFGWPAMLNGQYGGGPFFGSTYGNYLNWSGGFVTYHNFIEFTELARRMTGSNPDFRYERNTKRLLIFPEPYKRFKHHNWILLTVEVEPQIEELLGNEYVKRIVLAYAKILLGTIRKKFSSVQLVGGGQIDTSIGDEGKEELNQIIENIRQDEAKGNFFFIG